MPIGTGRILHMQQTHYFRKRVNYNDPGIAAGVYFGTLPAGALITRLTVRVNTGFNAATTNAVNVGTTALGTQILTDVATLGIRFPAAPNLSFAVDTDLYASYVQTGAVATAGQADIGIEYIPNNDQ